MRMRNIFSVLAGYAVWTAVFLGGSAVVRAALSSVHDDAGYTDNVTALLVYLALSVIASLLAGFVTARIAMPPKAKWVFFTSLALLATGVPVQLSVWELLPVWYNLVFLALLVPATLMGGRLGASAGSADPA